MKHATHQSSAAESHLAAKLPSGAKQARAPSAGGELSEEDLQAIDVAYQQKKTSGALRREQDHRALEDQVQSMRYAGAL